MARKIKHWAGYGCVMAERVQDDSCTMHIRITGDHERGLSRQDWDKDTMYNWLVHRWDKDAPKYFDAFTMQAHWEETYDCSLHTYVCDVYFTY